MGSSASTPAEANKETATTSDEQFKNLKCDTCQKYLSVPPILCSPDGKVRKCGREPCNSKWSKIYGTLSRNLLCEEAAKLLTFPCGVSQQCPEKLRWDNVLDHESVCPYRQIVCPKKSCKQQFKLENIQEHFKTAHHDFLVQENKKCFFHKELFSLPQFNDFFLFKTQELQVLIYIDFENNLGKLKFNAFAMSPLREPSKYTFKIDNCTGTGSITLENHVIIFPNTLDCTKGDLSDVPLNSINISSLTDNLGKLQNLFIDFKGETLLGNLAIGDVSASIPALLATFECPVCRQFMDSQVKLCIAGHSVCEKCYNEIDKTSKNCPECRQAFSKNQRNIKLEEVASKLSSLKVKR